MRHISFTVPVVHNAVFLHHHQDCSTFLLKSVTKNALNAISPRGFKKLKNDKSTIWTIMTRLGVSFERIYCLFLMKLFINKSVSPVILEPERNEWETGDICNVRNVSTTHTNTYQSAWYLKHGSCDFITMNSMQTNSCFMSCFTISQSWTFHLLPLTHSSNDLTQSFCPSCHKSWDPSNLQQQTYHFKQATKASSKDQC